MKKFLALTIFLGSFLLFAVEPMIGRTLLPVFGGTPSVWVTCLAAFQVLMVGGYFYAGKVRKGWVHVSLLVLSAAWCAAVALFRQPFLAALSGLPLLPAIDVLLCVAALCGVTFVLLSANSSVVQLISGGDYRLYAVSNAGSLIGLLSYPLLIEPNVSITAQWSGLGIGIVIYAALLFRAIRLAGDMGHETGSVEAEPQDSAHGKVRTLLYILLPAISTAILNATTSHLTLDVAPLPLLWAVLLALFLLSYIIGFSGWSRPGFWTIPTLAAAIAAACLNTSAEGDMHYAWQLAADSALILFSCTFVHSVLFGMRPGERGLARYYLLTVVGGAVGGVLTSIIAPLVFSSVAEFPLVIAISAVSASVYMVVRYSADSGFSVRRRAFLVCLHVVLSLAALVAICYRCFGADLRGRTYVRLNRGFFGTVSVMSAKAKSSSGVEGVIHEFIHGNTVHGIQARLPGKWRMPTSYYTPTGCGYAVLAHPKYRKGEPMRVNLVGLGVGVMFAYGRTNDYYRAYEISQDALDIATDTNLFSFVADCPAEKDVVLQDARKGLEAELAAGVEPYDVIVVDAFTGDNIPYHLSSREALELYFRLLKPDGILCMNISNWHLSLEPYIKKVAEVFDTPVLCLDAFNDFGQLSLGATTAFFCRNPEGMMEPPIGPGKARMIDFERVPVIKELPTDEKGSFLQFVSW